MLDSMEFQLILGLAFALSTTCLVIGHSFFRSRGNFVDEAATAGAVLLGLTVVVTAGVEALSRVNWAVVTPIGLVLLVVVVTVLVGRGGSRPPRSGGTGRANRPTSQKRRVGR